MAAMSGAWFRRKVPHPWLGGLGRWIMYFATLDWATSNPSLSPSAPPGLVLCRPPRLLAALQASATSNASTDESQPDANGRASQDG